MQVHYTLPSAPLLEACALTIGTFDGVHGGHQFLVRHLKKEAEARGLLAVALTFVDMPICHFRPDICPQLLTVMEEKVAAFGATALEHLFIVPFGQDLAGTRARDFMEFWCRVANLRLFVGGPDFALGRNREGNIPALRLLGEELGFEVLSLQDKLLAGGEAISSTRVRGMVESGAVEEAAKCLGEAYQLRGKVVPGQQLGRTIGFPTINIMPHERKCVPANGVYAVRVQLDEDPTWLPAAMNIGVRPTVDGTRLALEFHVLDMDIKLSPATATVKFVSRLRDETKFSGLDALVDQLHRDISRARQVLRGQ